MVAAVAFAHVLETGSQRRGKCEVFWASFSAFVEIDSWHILKNHSGQSTR